MVGGGVDISENQYIFSFMYLNSVCYKNHHHHQLYVHFLPILIYVVAKFELAKCAVEKVGQGQRLCNFVNIQILEGYPQAAARGKDGEGVVKLF